ncbi:fatty acid-binding protein, intestinal isoform X3 [Microcaecilia unicolor]|uniref:Fatty acid-binding protein, intestinal-like isoform X3 n=1 Tax=Microcaecilia unicolor TaxID=1415580 RepID=A0A6P7XDL9_9AMPH|nr:fatty acid-binding protein, intestinal-like isoform X3 [Microcaecilia unicolor]
MAFDGTWKLDRTENYDKFMEVMGVDEKLAAQDNLKMTIKQNGTQFSVTEQDVSSTSNSIFRLDEKIEYKLPGVSKKLVGTWKLHGKKMEGNFTRKDNNKQLKITYETVGAEFILTLLLEGVEAKKIFKRE